MTSLLPQPIRPDGFHAHVFERCFKVDRSRSSVWAWLMRPETFIEGQPWPYRVEFIDTVQSDGSISRGFDVGTRNAHHGPFMNFCGVITRVEEGAEHSERELCYAYGAYALAFRLIRPTRLLIRCDALDDQSCRVTVRVESDVRGWMKGPWAIAQRCFWPFFGFVMRRSVRRATRQAADSAPKKNG